MTTNTIPAYLNSSLLILSISFCTVSCSKPEPDEKTLNFTTSEGIKTSLDINNEIYQVIDHLGLFYMNHRYYKKNERDLWAFSYKVDGPWKAYPDQSTLPRALLLIDHSKLNQKK